MKLYTPLLCLSALFLRAQVVPPAASATPAPETVLATIEGKKLTFGELQNYLSAMDPERQKAALQNRTELVRQYAMMKHLVAMADNDKLDRKSPYKEALESSRMQILTNARINEEYLALPVSADDQTKFYENNKVRYSEVKLKVIYLSFASNPGAADSKSKVRSEAEARTKIESVLKEIRSGADFEKLVTQYSEDDKSKEKKGDFGTLRKSDNLPEEIRSVVFTLAKDQVSEPVRQRNGFYLFKAETVSTRPYEDVRSDIYTELKNVRMKEWLDGLSKSIPVKIEYPSFFEKNSVSPAAIGQLSTPPAVR